MRRDYLVTTLLVVVEVLRSGQSRLPTEGVADGYSDTRKTAFWYRILTRIALSGIEF